MNGMAKALRGNIRRPATEVQRDHGKANGPLPRQEELPPEPFPTMLHVGLLCLT